MTGRGLNETVAWGAIYDFRLLSMLFSKYGPKCASPRGRVLGQQTWRGSFPFWTTSVPIQISIKISNFRFFWTRKFNKSFALPKQARLIAHSSTRSEFYCTKYKLISRLFYTKFKKILKFISKGIKIL